MLKSNALIMSIFMLFQVLGVSEGIPCLVRTNLQLTSGRGAKLTNDPPKFLEATVRNDCRVAITAAVIRFSNPDWVQYREISTDYTISVGAESVAGPGATGALGLWQAGQERKFVVGLDKDAKDNVADYESWMTSAVTDRSEALGDPALRDHLIPIWRDQLVWLRKFSTRLQEGEGIGAILASKEVTDRRAALRDAKDGVMLRSPIDQAEMWATAISRLSSSTLEPTKRNEVEAQIMRLYTEQLKRTIALYAAITERVK